MSEDKDSFDYKPDNQNVATNSTVSISWTASEYIEHSRGKLWYVALVAGTVVLATLVYLLGKDVFAAIVIVVLGLIVASVAHRKPRQITYEIDNKGLKAADKTYNYHEFKSFAVVHDGALSSLMLVPLKKFAVPISMYFEADDEQEIVAIIGEHLPLEQRSPDRIDSLSRRLRF